MSTQIQKILKQAIITFRSDPQTFSCNMDLLSALTDEITAKELNLDISFACNAPDNDPAVAPVTYLNIFEDGVLSMGIFVLKANKSLPLHNHPDMHGVMKVLLGKIKIESYSINTPKTCGIDSNNYTAMNSPDGVSQKNVVAEFIGSEICDAQTKPDLLEPHHNNIHEICSVEGPAAFLHILSRSYNNDDTCSFYTISNKVTSELFILQEIESPSWYWNDYYPYCGPNPMEGLELNNL